MSDFTRLTVTGSTKRAELAVPSDEPLGAVLPQLIELLAEPVGTVARPMTLLSPSGESVQLELSPQDQGIDEGAALRLARLDSAPPPPVVIDLTDVLADSLEAHRGRWGQTARRAVGCVIVGLASAVALTVVPVPVGVRFGTLIGVLAALLVAAIAFGLGRLLSVSSVFASAATGAAVVVALEAERLTGGTLPAPTALVLALGVVLLLGVGVARRERAALAGGSIAVVLGAVMLMQLWIPTVQAAAVAGVLAALILGVLPWVALSTAGLTGLDQRAADGTPLPRTTADTAIGDAYRALSWSVIGTAAPLTVSAVELALDGGLWPVLLAVALGVVVLLRSRALPLRAQVLVLWAAGIAIAAALAPALVLAVGVWWAAVILVLIAVVTAIGALADPAPHQRARMRSYGNGLETLAVVALVPVAVGVFDIYADLLQVFGGGA